ncbi:hypothetical protein [Streptomyces sp. KO7888]|uniref:hypothetical protein n=1 Tax=Streptomyces sp. KO7888 TaxID=2602737 RepID=UPI0013F5AAF5|nr:hypothetical protein [Streptomyces sp. KO7888]
MSMSRPLPGIAVLAAAEDAAVDLSLCDFLRNAGLPPAADGCVDVVVVLISVAAVDDPEWRQRVERARAVRLIPVRVDGVRTNQAPEYLRPINWVTLDRAAPATAFGAVLAAALSDPEQIRELRNLRAQAEAWIRENRSMERLMYDHRDAAEAHELLAGLREEGYVDVRGPVGEFVETSYRYTGKARRRKQRRRAMGTVLGVIMAVAVAITVPRILKTRGTDFNSLVTFGDPSTVRVMPEWTSLQASSLLLRGNEAQKELARDSLSSTLSVPWSLGGPVLGSDGQAGLVDGLTPLPGGKRAAVLVQEVPGDVSSLGLYDIHSGTVTWRVRLGTGYQNMATSGDGRTVVVVGEENIAVVDLQSRKVRRLAHREDGYVDVALTEQGDLVVGRAEQLVVGSTGGTRFRPVGEGYAELLDLRATADGGVRALVATEPGHYRLVNALTGDILARADVAAPLITTGAVAPDADYAVFVGADRQLWRLDAGRAAVPTGVATPERTETAAVLSGGRVVVGGQDQPAHVVRLADAGDLGIVCRDVPQLRRLVPSDDVLVCRGPHNVTLWRAPAGPRRPRARDGLRAETTASGAFDVRADGGRVHIGLTGRGAFTLDLFTDEVIALALSPDGSQLVATTAQGDVAVASLHMSDGRARVVARWRIPGGQPATAVSWPGTSPLVGARDGWVWAVPACPGCTTDSGLIERVKQRLSGCWGTEQLTNVDTVTRRAVGVTECGALPESVEG